MSLAPEDPEYPDVRARNIRPNRTFPGALVVEADCPHCSGTHVHGIPAEDVSHESWGYRNADCFNGGYRLLPPL